MAGRSKRRRGKRRVPKAAAERGAEDEELSAFVAELRGLGLTDELFAGPWASVEEAVLSAVIKRPLEEQTAEELFFTVDMLLVCFKAAGKRISELERRASALPGRLIRSTAFEIDVTDDRRERRVQVSRADRQFRVRESLDDGKTWQDLPLTLAYWSGVKNAIYRAWPPREVIDVRYFGEDLQVVVRGHDIGKHEDRHGFLATYSRRGQSWELRGLLNGVVDEFLDE